MCSGSVCLYLSIYLSIRIGVIARMHYSRLYTVYERELCRGFHNYNMCPFVAVGPLFGGGFGGGGYTFTVPGLPPAAHAMTKTNFLFEHSKYLTNNTTCTILLKSFFFNCVSPPLVFNDVYACSWRLTRVEVCLKFNKHKFIGSSVG